MSKVVLSRDVPRVSKVVLSRGVLCVARVVHVKHDKGVLSVSKVV